MKKYLLACVVMMCGFAFAKPVDKELDNIAYEFMSNGKFVRIVNNSREKNTYFPKDSVFVVADNNEIHISSVSADEICSVRKKDGNIYLDENKNLVIVIK